MEWGGGGTRILEFSRYTVLFGPLLIVTSADNDPCDWPANQSIV